MSLGCIAFAGIFIFDEDSDENDSLNSGACELKSELVPDCNDISPDTAGDLLHQSVGNVGAENDSSVSLKQVSQMNSLIVDGIALEQSVEAVVAVDDYDQSVSVISVDTDGGVSPLAEWISDSELEIVKLSDVDSVFVENSAQSGSLKVIQADYFERLPSGEGDILHNIHSGANVYFIPEGEEFPEEYQWSESGASLYNTSTFDSQAADFGGVKHILRIDTGYMHADNESEQAIEFRSRAFIELQEQFSSDGKVHFEEVRRYN